MKTNRILTLLLAALLVALAVEVVYALNLWNIRGVQPSEVYRRYADTPGVNAAYIKDYQVNDTVTVSVTLLEAIDSTGWTSLKKDFKIEAILDSIQGLVELNETARNLRLAPKTDYNLPKDSVMANNDLIITLFHSHIICIFHLENKEQYHVIYKKQFNEMNPKF